MFKIVKDHTCILDEHFPSAFCKYFHLCHDPLTVVTFPAVLESRSSQEDLAMGMASIEKTINNYSNPIYNTAKQIVDNFTEKQNLRKRHGIFS